MRMRRAIGLTAALVFGVGCKSSTPHSSIVDSGATGDGACVPSPEICDGMDNNCDGVIDEGCTPQPAANLLGLCSLNQQLCDVHGLCVDDPANYVPTPELCDGLDNDCDGVVDNGCDADHDGHCASTMLVIGKPAVCPLSPAGLGDDCNDKDPDMWSSCATCADRDGDGAYAGCDQYLWRPKDCDDNDPTRSPRLPELCYDGVDNNCDGAVDEACPAFTISIATTGSVEVLHPGETRVFAALVSPQAPPANMMGAVVATNGCSDTDVTIGSITSAGTRQPVISVSAGASPTLDGCNYTLTVLAGGATAAVHIRVQDAAPTIVGVNNARQDTQGWTIVGIFNTSLPLVVTAFDPDTTSSAFTYTWQDSTGVLQTGASPSLSLPIPPPPTYPAAAFTDDITVQVSDGVKTGSATIHVVGEGCVWASQAGGGDGSLPTQPTNDLTGVSGAINTAWGNGSDVCILGSSIFTGPVVLDPSPYAAGTHQPSLLGFMGATTPVTTPLATIQGSGSGTTALDLRAGYNGTIAGLLINATGGATSAVLVTNGSPAIVGCRVTLAAASGAVADAVHVIASGATANPEVVKGYIDATGAGSSVTAVRVETASSGTASALFDGLDHIQVSGCTGSKVVPRLVCSTSPPSRPPVRARAPVRPERRSPLMSTALPACIRPPRSTTTA